MRASFQSDGIIPEKSDKLYMCVSSGAINGADSLNNLLQGQGHRDEDQVLSAIIPARRN